MRGFSGLGLGFRGALLSLSLSRSSLPLSLALSLPLSLALSLSFSRGLRSLSAPSVQHSANTVCGTFDSWSPAPTYWALLEE